MDLATSSFPASNIIAFLSARRTLCRRRFGMVKDRNGSRQSEGQEPETPAEDLILHHGEPESLTSRRVGAAIGEEPMRRAGVRLIGLCHEPDGSGSLRRSDEDIVAFVFDKMVRSGLTRPFARYSHDSRTRGAEPGVRDAIKLLDDGVPLPVDPEKLVELMIV